MVNLFQRYGDEYSLPYLRVVLRPLAENLG